MIGFDVLSDFDFTPGACPPHLHWRAVLDATVPPQRSTQFEEVIERASGSIQTAARATTSDSDVLWLSAPGTMALEAAIACLPTGSDIVVLDGGYFGNRLYELAIAHHNAVQRVVLNRTQGVQADQVDSILGLIRPAPTARRFLLCTHLETSTGVLNSLDAAREIARAVGAGLVVDGISGFGASAIAFDACGIDIYVGALYKNALSPDVETFMIVRRSLMDQPDLRQGIYSMNVRRMSRSARRNSHLWTPSRLSLLAFDSYARAVEREGGWIKLYTDLLERKDIICAEFQRLGIAIVASPACSSATHFAVCLPAAMDPEEVVLGLERHSGFLVAGPLDDHAEVRMAWYPSRPTSSLDIIKALHTQLERMER